jgi:1A family penicillin-binding protein
MTPVKIAFPRDLNWKRLAALGVIVAIAGAILLSIASLASELSALRAFKASTPGWSFPSHIYSDWLELDPRRNLPRGYVLASLAARGYHPASHPLSQPGTLAETAQGVEVYLRGFDYPESVSTAGRVRLQFTGGKLARVAVEPGGPSAPRLEPVLLRRFSTEDNMERTYVPEEQIPTIVKAAILSAEDRRFYHHIGLDPRGTARALVHNMRGHEGMQGGSTLTQQLARTLFLTRQRSLARKLRETILALGLELLLTKQQIFEMYLNAVYLGHVDNSEVGGVAEGAHFYFDKSVRDLTLPEAALLASIIPAPNLYSPFRSARAALQRRNLVLRDMVASGWIDSATAARAAAAPLGVRKGHPQPGLFPFYTDYALTEASKDVDVHDLQTRGLRVFTALDPVWQARAETELSAGVADLERTYGRRGPAPLEGAACVLEPNTGLVRAVVGGRDYRKSPFNRATQSFRQPGSAFKPLVYAAAFDRNLHDPNFTAATTLPDLPREFATPEGPWRPHNDDGSYHDQVTIAKAIAKSLNIATANLTEKIGAKTVVQYAEKLGIQNVRPVPSVGLGTSEVSLARLCSVYGTIQSGGVRVDPEPVRLIVDAGGRVEYRAVPPHDRVFDPLTSALMTQLLRGVIDFGTGFALKSDYGFRRPAAGKTGTTDENRDTWFVGFTPDLLCGVWLGYDLPTTIGETASQTAAPLWGRVVSSLLSDFPVSTFPETVPLETAVVDSYSGGLATAMCPSVIRAPFEIGTTPKRGCTVDHSAEWMEGPEFPGPGEDTTGAEQALPPHRD